MATITTLRIETSRDVSDSTYFTTSSTEPDLTHASDEDVLTIYSGRGRSRSGWGAPETTSTVVVERADLVAIHVGWHHKHGGGQTWRYYVPTAENGRWEQTDWVHLSDALRTRVLDAVAHKHAPYWAKAPGKLRTEHKEAQLLTQIGYKIVRVLDDGRMVSLFNGTTEYVVGRRLAQAARPDHAGGFYSWLSADEVREVFESGYLVPARCYVDGMRVALLRVEISGTVLEYDHMGKVASTYLRPLDVLDTWTYEKTEAEEAVN